jgi:succinate-semialdehyde dehydrogenase/glutarate-semialdehyde dehydrogenase
MAGSLMKPATMELGGHSPVIVCDDADVEAAADIMAGSKFRNAGQVCVSPTRFYVQEKAYDKFVARFLDKVKGLKVGPGTEPDTKMGPLAHKRRVPAIAGFVEDADARGAKILTGGHKLGERGSFFEPTGGRRAARGFEAHDPGALRPDHGAEALQDARRGDRTRQLTAVRSGRLCVHDEHEERDRIGDNLESGMVTINHLGFALAETPFGGVKDSGHGSEGGTETFEGYLVTKFVTQKG